MSARIAQEAGFELIWASGLGMSAARGVRDANELSWSQVVTEVEFMVDATSVPILVDGDSGHGDFNNARRFSVRLERAGAAGVCIEDKCFPKQNSFVDGPNPLAPAHQFCDKLRAILDSRRDSRFSVVARTEAFIAGAGLREALERAHAAADVGVDAVVVHSKSETAHEVLSFLDRWDRDVPVIAIPTTYAAAVPDQLERGGVSGVLFANQLLRAAITAMTSAAARILADRSTAGLEGEIASVKRIFELQRLPELRADEQHYRSDGTGRRQDHERLTRHSLPGSVAK